MNKALFITENDTSIISPQDIHSRKDYQEKYIGKLFCSEPGCHAQLDYVELPFIGHEKIFRTHKGSEHLETCPHKITHNYDGGPTFSSETFSQAISLGHIKSVLKALYQRNIAPSMASAPNRTKNISKHHIKDVSPSLVARPIASIDPDATPVATSEREASVRKRRSQDLLAEDNQKLRGIDGIIDHAYIGEDYVELFFTPSSSKTSLLFYNAFRDKSVQAYRYVKELAQLLNSSDLKILVCCLGVVEILTGKNQIQIMAPEYITFEGLSIYSYMSLKVS